MSWHPCWVVLSGYNLLIFDNVSKENEEKFILSSHNLFKLLETFKQTMAINLKTAILLAKKPKNSFQEFGLKVTTTTTTTLVPFRAQAFLAKEWLEAIMITRKTLDRDFNPKPDKLL
eukprot:TRINITY_DN1448_c0_g1_i8.p1 TRINITY_DN1448_c0_g1~~TRINITY_DN1448_c0_g1_i8.p1  ORF type:complete len:117 (+),score=21.07 TRINITY_DN1448_c0_g1_i8:2291-2641(+)